MRVICMKPTLQQGRKALQGRKAFLLLVGIVFVSIAASMAVGLELTEIMYNPDGADAGREWVEVYADAAMNLSKARIVDHGGPHLITPHLGESTVIGYAIITNSAATFLAEHPFYEGQVFQAAISLSNTGEAIAITENGEVEDNVTYTNLYANGNGRTLEKVAGTWEESQDVGGTPGYGIPGEVPEMGLIATGIAIAGGIAGFYFMRRR